MDLQHINVKLLVNRPAEVDLEALIPVFHSWIQEQVAEELLLDVADYRHVSAGPGVVLIGHEANYSLDNTDNRLGVRYNRKAPLEGTNQDRLFQAARAALAACRRLETEVRLGGKIRFSGREIEVFINDRLLAPNSQATREAAGPEFQTFFERLFASPEFALSYPQDQRSLFSVTAKSVRAYESTELLANLQLLGCLSNPR